MWERNLSKKLSKAERRVQLLETAQTMVRESGTDALSLGALAARAGVSKPVAYNHFESRSGLMVALYRKINERQVLATEEAVRQAPTDLHRIAQLLAQAYMECHEAVGPEFHAIGGALKGDLEMEAYQREMVDGHVALYAEALAPHSGLPEAEVRRRCIAIIGAADALSGAMVRQRVSKAEAVEDVVSLITVWLGFA